MRLDPTEACHEIIASQQRSNAFIGMTFLVSTFLEMAQEAWQTLVVVWILGSVLPKQSDPYNAFS
jgi:hypothetical protein